MIYIAFLSFDWNYDVINQYYEGIQEYVKEHDDVSVCIFHGFGKYGSDDPEKGSFAIYDLPDFSMFDGVIIQGNRNWPLEMRQEIANKAIDSGAVVASLNYPLDGTIYIGTDNYGAMKEMTDHILDKHNVDNPVFVCGLETSIEAIDRKKAFIESCEEHNIKEIKTYPGGWSIDYGKNAANQIIADYGKNNLPKAIICCSDELALGVIQVFKHENIKIPDDVLVTGFDNRRFAVLGNPRISSVDRNYVGIGYACMDVIHLKINGFKLQRHLYCPCKVIFSESCGCKENIDLNREIKDQFYEMDHALKGFYRRQDVLEPSMLQAETIYDLMEATEEHYDVFGVERIYLVINNDYLDGFDKDTVTRNFGKKSSLMGIGGNHVGLKCDKNHIYEIFDSNKILPDQLRNDKHFLIIYPIRNNEDIIGYVVTEGLPNSQKYNFHEIYFMVYANAIEAIRKKTLLKKLNGKLDNLYVRDSLTGFYNRFGLQRYGKRAYERYLKENGQAYFNFIDIDDMKKINDIYGHEQGDAAILETSGIIKIACLEKDVVMMRYGGDEFLTISAESMKEKLEASEKEMISQNENPYSLRLSIGEYKVSKNLGLTIEQCIEKADAIMYEVKKLHKVGCE